MDLLEGLKFDTDERPRLVHRLDRDTSGVLMLARSRAKRRHLWEKCSKSAIPASSIGLLLVGSTKTSARADRAIISRKEKAGLAKRCRFAMRTKRMGSLRSPNMRS